MRLVGKWCIRCIFSAVCFFIDAGGVLTCVAFYAIVLVRLADGCSSSGDYLRVCSDPAFTTNFGRFFQAHYV